MSTASSSAAAAVSDWDDQYATLARSVSQLRSNLTPAATSRTRQIHSIRQGLDRLDRSLSELEGQLILHAGEVGRRRTLVEGLRMQLDGMMENEMGLTSAAMGESAFAEERRQTLSSTSAALLAQEEMLGDLQVGVARLRNQTQAIHDESRQHVKLLDEIDGDVERAGDGFMDGTEKAKKIREGRSVARLYWIICCEVGILIWLLLLGLS